ncbi:hypothetical protein [Flavobacterium sp. FlaQc-48]|uniref:hypothetical protein n=1 Tax=Flavobacterium sp. FlaQc-48 TaxID=3374181 RepID=UPI00375769EF
MSEYHLEAGIAYWHTQKKDSVKKWEHILELYNNLIILEYSPIVALTERMPYPKYKANRKPLLKLKNFG